MGKLFYSLFFILSKFLFCILDFGYQIPSPFAHPYRCGAGAYMTIFSPRAAPLSAKAIVATLLCLASSTTVSHSAAAI